MDAADDDQIKQAAKNRGLTPVTRRLVVAALALIAIVAIAAELWLSLADKTTSDALVAIAAASAGGIAGLVQAGD